MCLILIWTVSFHLLIHPQDHQRLLFCITHTQPYQLTRSSKTIIQESTLSFQQHRSCRVILLFFSDLTITALRSRPPLRLCWWVIFHKYELLQLYPLAGSTNGRLVIRAWCRDLAHLFDVAINTQSEVPDRLVSQFSCSPKEPERDTGAYILTTLDKKPPKKTLTWEFYWKLFPIKLASFLDFTECQKESWLIWIQYKFCFAFVLSAALKATYKETKTWKATGSALHTKSTKEPWGLIS